MLGINFKHLLAGAEHDAHTVQQLATTTHSEIILKRDLLPDQEVRKYITA